MFGWGSVAGTCVGVMLVRTRTESRFEKGQCYAQFAMQPIYMFGPYGVG